MKVNLETLEKLKDELPAIANPFRLAILIILYGAEVLEEQKKKSGKTER